MTSPSPIILFTSLSAKISLWEKVLQSAQRFDEQSRVIGVDCNPDCPAASRVKEFATIPPLEKMDLDALTNYCLELGITHVVPTRDEELGYWSARSDHLEQNGIHVMVSEESTVKTCQDKLLFSRSLGSLAIPPIDSSVELSQLNCNFFAVKERSGSASRSIGLNLVAKEAIEHAKGLDRPIFQPMIEGKEFSAETWINASGKCHGMLLRWRTKIIDGEAHQTETFENREWQKLLKSSFEAISGFSGHALAQVIFDPEQSLHLIEINLA